MYLFNSTISNNSIHIHTTLFLANFAKFSPTLISNIPKMLSISKVINAAPWCKKHADGDDDGDDAGYDYAPAACIEGDGDDDDDDGGSDYAPAA
ncbi:hypothetical protein O6P43_023039 [Quillaja saponaria]|uniref:Uncharacterized protein n=1 Tax=Quillaja saponaria TaxID=32244 RepID=A0AAD7LEE7_QUISA|nr:hypothetical protein O6P43_023039 [Quillaja saponaria]